MAKSKKTYGPSKVVGKDRNGVTVVDVNTGVRKKLLNPAGKGRKFAAELKSNKHYTNDGKTKVTKSGKLKRLTDTERSYRSGYLQARQDSAKAFKSKSYKSVTQRSNSKNKAF